MRTLLFYFCFVISLIITALLLPIWHFLGILGLQRTQKTLSHYTSFFWARFLIMMAGVRVKVYGGEKVPSEGPVLFISNHQGNFDIPVLLGYINKSKGFLAKIELTKIPIVHSWMQKMGCVFINRSDMRQSVKAIQQCAEVLKKGQSMVIFPEGTRSKGDTMAEFKKGSLRVAEKVKIPIVPVSISGTYKIMEANKNRIQPSDVTITISDPVFYDKLSEEEKNNFHSLMRNIVAQNIQY